MSSSANLLGQAVDKPLDLYNRGGLHVMMLARSTLLLDLRG